MEAIDSSNNEQTADHLASEAMLDRHDEVTSPIHPVAPYPPPFSTAMNETTRARAKSTADGRAPEFYGFVAWLITLLVYFTYILWALLPDWAIRATGITWYPARKWAILLPAWSVVLFLTAYFVYIALGIYATPELSHMSTITDPRAHYARAHHRTNQTVQDQDWYLQFTDKNAVPAPYDMPLALVNRVLFKTTPDPASAKED